MIDESLYTLIESLQNSNEQLHEENANLRRDHEDLKRRFEHVVAQIDDHLDIEWATRREVEEIKVKLRQ